MVNTSPGQVALKTWAVTPGQVQDPLFSDPRISNPDELAGAVQTVQDVIYLLPTVAETHTDKRAALVGILGAALARALNDQHSRRWYCKTIWAAWTTELEGRGGLQVLAAQLARLDVERQEWGRSDGLRPCSMPDFGRRDLRRRRRAEGPTPLSRSQGR